MPITGRPREFDRDAALQAAVLVFWRKGFLATSIKDLCDAMNIRSPSLYAAFGSKEALYAEVIQRYNDSVRSLIWNHLDDGPTVQDGVRKALLAAAKALPGGAGIPSGCLVTMDASGDPDDGSIPEIIKQGRLDGLQMLRLGIQRAVTTQELTRSTNVESLSRFYQGIVQGMAIQARDGATQADLEGMAEVAMAAWPAN